MQLKTLEERIIWWYLLGTYVWYLLGATYVISSVIGWLLAIRALVKWYRGEIQIPKIIWMWLFCISLFILGTLIASIDNGFTGVNLIRNIAGELFSNALLAIFPLVGCLSIRPKVIYRAVSILVGISICLIPFFVLAASIKLEGYISPLIIVDKIIKTGINNYKISFFNKAEPHRISLFCPWAPALGFVASQFFFICKEEKNKILSYIGMLGSTLMVTVSYSRLGLIALPFSLLMTYIISYLRDYKKIAIGGLLISLIVVILGDIRLLLTDVRDSLNSARSSSSIVRERLQEIAIRRIWEAPWFGHASTEKGGLIVAGMPIGTHHTWNGYLFVNGIFGTACILIPYLISIVKYAIEINKSKLNEVCFSILLVMGLYSVGETWKSLAYLLMPGLILIGIGFKEE